MAVPLVNIPAALIITSHCCRNMLLFIPIARSAVLMK